jgi:hypothetical protein
MDVDGSGEAEKAERAGRRSLAALAWLDLEVTKADSKRSSTSRPSIEPRPSEGSDLPKRLVVTVMPEARLGIIFSKGLSRTSRLRAGDASYDVEPLPPSLSRLLILSRFLRHDLRFTLIPSFSAQYDSPLPPSPNPSSPLAWKDEIAFVAFFSRSSSGSTRPSCPTQPACLASRLVFDNVRKVLVPFVESHRPHWPGLDDSSKPKLHVVLGELLSF